MMAEFYRACFRPLRSWWQNDRIRVLPRDGRLLRVEPGDLLIFRGIEAEVLIRSTSAGPAGFSLTLVCDTSAELAELVIAIGLDGKVLGVRWQNSKGTHWCSADDFEVWPRSRMV